MLPETTISTHLQKKLLNAFLYFIHFYVHKKLKSVKHKLSRTYKQ